MRNYIIQNKKLQLWLNCTIQNQPYIIANDALFFAVFIVV